MGVRGWQKGEKLMLSPCELGEHPPCWQQAWVLHPPRAGKALVVLVCSLGRAAEGTEGGPKLGGAAMGTPQH